jgi:hypothetical protein
VSGILPARFPGELRNRLREIKIDLVRATARVSDGLPTIPKQRRTALDSASDSHASEARSSRCLKSDPSNEQIAQVLDCGKATTKVHLHRIY